VFCKYSCLQRREFTRCEGRERRVLLSAYCSLYIYLPQEYWVKSANHEAPHDAFSQFTEEVIHLRPPKATYHWKGRQIKRNVPDILRQDGLFNNIVSTAMFFIVQLCLCWLCTSNLKVPGRKRSSHLHWKTEFVGRINVWDACSEM
jgi:hypothetical protein